MIARSYWDKVYKDKALAPSQQLTYVTEGHHRRRIGRWRSTPTTPRR